MASLHSYLDNDNSEATMNGLEESKELEDSNPRGNLIVSFMQILWFMESDTRYQYCPH